MADNNPEIDPPGKKPKDDKRILEIAAEGLKKGKIQRGKNEIEYFRFKEHFKGIDRGTVIVKGMVIRGFPHIMRIFTLEKGIRHNLEGTDRLFVEEKIDGFNVRIAYIGDKIYGFSRGGFLESFVTEKSREMKLGKFFKDNPKCVLCGEMIGNTPYTAPSDEFDTKLFVFDIDDGEGNYMSPSERYRLLDKYDIPSVPRLGNFDSSDIQGLKRIALSLNKGRKEGMVIKSADRRKAVKYVTPNSDIEDIAQCSSILFDMPIGFFYQRVLRSAFFMKDFGLDRGEYSRMLGEAFYKGLEKSLALAAEGEPVAEEFEIVFQDPEVWEDVKRHMGREVKLEELFRRKEKDGRTRIRFRKIFKKSTKLMSSFANGKGVTD
jgi:putative ATP-dependent DNA ligase